MADVTAKAATQHAILILSSVRAEALADRIDDKTFRLFVMSLTDGLELPPPGLTVLPGGGDAA